MNPFRSPRLLAPLLVFCAWVCKIDVVAKLNFMNEQVATTYFVSTNPNHIVTKDEVTDGIEKCWLDVSEILIRKSIEQENDYSSEIKKTINSLKQRLDRLIAISNTSTNVDIINASFQWAQSVDQIFLNIKFSHRWSSPGALKVRDETIESRDNHFYFSAFSNDPTQTIKKYIVDITLLHNVVQSETKYNFASVGKVVVSMKKEKRGVWSRLLLSKEKNPHLQVWWDMKEKYDEEIRQYIQNRRKDREKRRAQAEANDTELTKEEEGEAGDDEEENEEYDYVLESNADNDKKDKAGEESNESDKPSEDKLADADGHMMEESTINEEL